MFGINFRYKSVYRICFYHHGFSMFGITKEEADRLEMDEKIEASAPDHPLVVACHRHKYIGQKMIKFERIRLGQNISHTVWLGSSGSVDGEPGHGGPHLTGNLELRGKRMQTKVMLTACVIT